MADGPLSIVVICEARADQHAACDIADRVLSQAVDWMQPELLAHFRQWRGLKKSEPFLAWKNVHINGHFEGQPGAHDAFVARRS